jgi:hypothetical protein
MWRVVALWLFALVIAVMIWVYWKNRVRIVVSLTTIPSRLEKLPMVLDSLIDKQTVKPDVVYLNVPHVFGRTGEVYDMSKLHYSNPRLKILRCDDYGPVTKVLPALEAEHGNERTVILYTDDDAIPPPDFVEQYVRQSRRKPGHVMHAVCGQGFYTKSPTPIDDNQGCTLPEAFEGILLPVDAVKDLDDFKEFVMKAIRNKSCFKSDDYVVGAYLTSRGIPRSSVYGIRNRFERMTDKNGLSDIDGTHAARYEPCYKYLKAISA